MDKLQELETCFFGTPVDREPGSGVRRQKRADDGWRSGASKPFEWKGRTYDVVTDTVFGGEIVVHGQSQTNVQYERLRAEILEADGQS